MLEPVASWVCLSTKLDFKADSGLEPRHCTIGCRCVGVQGAGIPSGVLTSIQRYVPILLFSPLTFTSVVLLDSGKGSSRKNKNCSVSRRNEYNANLARGG